MNFFPPPNRSWSIIGLDANPPPTPKEERFTISDLGGAVRKITPTLLIIGIATGAAFAIGSGLVHHYLFNGK